jgi:hypothetical protein
VLLPVRLLVLFAACSNRKTATKGPEAPATPLQNRHSVYRAEVLRETPRWTLRPRWARTVEDLPTPLAGLEAGHGAAHGAGPLGCAGLTDRVHIVVVDA